jgi:hypothetical protein
MDFFELIEVSGLLLLITSLLNLFMGGVVWFRKGIKSKMFLYFVILTFFNFVWGIALFFTLISPQVYLAEFWYRTCYLGALGIAPALLYFAIHFPFQSQKISRVYNIVIGFFFTVLFFLIYSKWHITSFVKINDTSEIIVNYYKPVYFLYSIYFIVLVVYAMKILYDKFRASEGIIRYQIIVLLITILVGLIFGFYFDLLLIYFHDFTYVWLGPLFTLPMNLAVFYLIFFDRKQ